MNGSRIVGYDSEQSNPINGSKQVMAFTFRVKSGASAGSSLSAAVSGVSVSYIRSSDGNAVTVDAGSARWSASVSAPLSANANLAALSCANAELSPTFSAGTTQYSVTVPYDVTSLRLSASAEDGGAKVSTSGNDLSVGANTVTITVTAPSGRREALYHLRHPPAGPELHRIDRRGALRAHRELWGDQPGLHLGRDGLCPLRPP